MIGNLVQCCGSKRMIRVPRRGRFIADQQSSIDKRHLLCNQYKYCNRIAMGKNVFGSRAPLNLALLYKNSRKQRRNSGELSLLFYLSNSRRPRISAENEMPLAENFGDKQQNREKQQKQPAPARDYPG